MKIISQLTDKEFVDYFRLRWEILRKPWDKPIGSERDEMEDSSFHFLLLNDVGQAAAVCRLQVNSEIEAQLRYMAVDSNIQGKGFGSTIIKAAELKAKELNCNIIILQARETAVDFYKKNGYEVVEKTYLMWDKIQHYLMKKFI